MNNLVNTNILFIILLLFIVITIYIFSKDIIIKKKYEEQFYMDFDKMNDLNPNNMDMEDNFEKMLNKKMDMEDNFEKMLNKEMNQKMLDKKKMEQEMLNNKKMEQEMLNNKKMEQEMLNNKKMNQDFEDDEYVDHRLDPFDPGEIVQPSIPIPIISKPIVKPAIPIVRPPIGHTPMPQPWEPKRELPDLPEDPSECDIEINRLVNEYSKLKDLLHKCNKKRIDIDHKYGKCQNSYQSLQGKYNECDNYRQDFDSMYNDCKTKHKECDRIKGSLQGKYNECDKEKQSLLKKCGGRINLPRPPPPSKRPTPSRPPVSSPPQLRPRPPQRPPPSKSIYIQRLIQRLDRVINNIDTRWNRVNNYLVRRFGNNSNRIATIKKDYYRKSRYDLYVNHRNKLLKSLSNNS